MLSDLNQVFVCLLLLFDGIKLVSGQFGDVLDLNHLFVGLLVLLENVKPVSGQFGVV